MTALKRTVIAWVSFCVGAAAATPPDLDEYIILFDGKTLKGWEQKGGKAEYRVEEGELVGRTVPDTPNSFLCTRFRYSDFILEYEFKCHPELNSGVQIRSEAPKVAKTYSSGGKEIKVPAGRVHGYQVEIDPNNPDRMWTGGIYDEGRRGWLYPGPLGGDAAKFTEEGKRLYKKEDWNRVRVEARGPSIKTWLNGEPRADLKDEMSPSGFVALQVHGVGDRKDPLEVRWRNLRIQVLGEKARAEGIDESREPPLRFTATIGDKTVELLEGEESRLEGDFKDPRVAIRVAPTRIFPYGGVSFQYPRSFGFEADLSPAVRIWTLSGNEFKIMLHSFPVEVTPMHHAESTMDVLGKSNCKVIDGQAVLSLGVHQVKGVAIQATIATHRMQMEFYRIPLSRDGSSLLVLQDSPGDSGTRSKEGAEAIKLLAATFKANE